MQPRVIRALVGSRVSHLQGEEKTSHHTQREKGDAYRESQDWALAGYFEDLDVSAIKLSPWERPDLRKWLTDRVDEWDALIFAKTDRVFRSAADCIDLARWCEKNRKILVLVDDGIKLDYYNPEDSRDAFAGAMSKVFLILASVFAEIEGKRFVQRANDRVSALRGTDRWGYGIPPYGYVVIDHPSGKGKSLAHDLDAQAVLRSIASRFLSGESLTRIAHDLNESGTLAPRDLIRKRSGKPIRGDRWYVSRMKSILTSPATQGIKLANKRPVLTPEGEPVRVGPPSFDNETWTRLQSEIAKRGQNPRQRKHSDNPLLGVGKCAVCGKNLRQRSQTTPAGVTHRYYLCGNNPRACPGVSMIASEAEELVEQTFLEIHSQRKVKVQIWQPGSDHSHELEQVKQTIESLREDRAMGLFTTPEDEEMFRTQVLALIARRDALARQPITRAGWITAETDQTYGDVWPTSTTEEKRKMLIDANVRLKVKTRTEWHLEADFDRVLGTGPTGEELYKATVSAETLD